jgi:hypothetical protein
MTVSSVARPPRMARLQVSPSVHRDARSISHKREAWIVGGAPVVCQSAIAFQRLLLGAVRLDLAIFSLQE